MKVEELNYDDKINNEVYEGLKELEEGLKEFEELIKNSDDKETILFEIKKMKMKHDEIHF